MMLSQFIQELQNFLDKVGDVPVVMNPENSPGQYYEAGAWLSVVGPDDMMEDSGRITEETPVCEVIAAYPEPKLGDPWEQAVSALQDRVRGCQVALDTVESQPEAMRGRIRREAQYELKEAERHLAILRKMRQR